MRLRRSSLRGQLIVGTAVSLIAVSAMAILAIWSLQEVVSRFEATVGITSEQMHRMMHLPSLLEESKESVAGYIKTGSQKDRRRFLALMQEIDDEYRELLSSNNKDRPWYPFVRASASDWRRAKGVGASIMAVPDPEGDGRVAGLQRRFNQVTGSAARVLVRADHAALNESESSLQRVVTLRNTVLGVMGGGAAIIIVILLLGSMVIVTSFSNSLLLLKEAIVSFGHGDYSVRVPAVGNELGELGDTLNVMAIRLKEREAELEESRAGFKAVVETAVDAVISIDGSGRIALWNRSATETFGYSEAEVVGRDVAMLIPARYKAAHRDGLNRVMSGGESRLTGKTVDLFGLKKDGSEFPLELSLAQWVSTAGMHFTGIIRDISDRKMIELALRESEERFRVLVEYSSESISRIGLDGRFQFMSPAGLRAHGMSSVAEVEGLPCTDLVQPEFRELTQETFERAKSGEIVRFQYQSGTIGGVRWFESVLSPQTDEHARVISVIMLSSDINDRKIIQQKLEYVATHDALTDLYNRGEFFNKLDDEVNRTRRYGGQFAFVMFDIDHFKSVNDAYGHLAGDTILRVVAHIIKESSRSVDVVGRYGGEEFAVIAPETTPEDTRIVAERIRQAISDFEIIVTPQKKIKVSVSAGIAGFPEDADSVLELVNHADKALYKAKSEGRNRTHKYAAGEDTRDGA